MDEMSTIPEWTLGDRLRKARERTGLNQTDFAKALGVGGRSTVANWETNHVKPRPIVVREWSRITDVPEWWLWGSDAPENLVGAAPRRSGWTPVFDLLADGDPGRKSVWIYVSPDQLTLDEADRSDRTQRTIETLGAVA